MKISKIALGTAQLGMNYGIANISGKPNFKNALKLLKYSWKNGITLFDTAPGYGNSEEILGTYINTYLKERKADIIISTKLPKIELNIELSFNALYNHIKKQVIQSLNKLNLKKLPIYLLHNSSDILFGKGLVIECLNAIKNEGLIDNFGLSIYNPNEAEEALNYKELNVIQVPINIFDHRLIKTGLLQKLKKKNYIILARSIYLQGIFFLPLENIPKYLELAKVPLIKLKNLSKEYNIEISKIAFLYIRDLPEISSLIVGSEKIEQIAENLKLLNENPLPYDLKKRINEEFSNLPEKLINPSLWNK